jgi:hypothetical protein
MSPPPPLLAAVQQGQQQGLQQQQGKTPYELEREENIRRRKAQLEACLAGVHTSALHKVRCCASALPPSPPLPPLLAPLSKPPLPCWTIRSRVLHATLHAPTNR